MNQTQANEEEGVMPFRSGRNTFIIVILIPIAAVTIYVTSHRYSVSSGHNHARWVLSDDGSIAIRELRVALPFQKIRQRFDAFDLWQSQHLWTWMPNESDSPIVSVSDDGSRMCVRVGALFFVNQFTPPHERLREIPLQWKGRYPLVRWVEGDTKPIRSRSAPIATNDSIFSIVWCAAGLEPRDVVSSRRFVCVSKRRPGYATDSFGLGDSREWGLDHDSKVLIGYRNGTYEMATSWATSRRCSC